MATAESNRVSLKYVPETVYGTTPVDSTDWKYIRFTGESFSASTTMTPSNEIRSDRHIASAPKTARSASGGFDLELSPSTFDDFLEAALCGTWTTNVLEVGTTQRSFSVEKHFEDLGRYLQLTGMRVTSANLVSNTNSILTGNFGFMGNGETRGTTSVVGTGSVAAADTNDVYNVASDVGSITIDGSSTGFCISALTLDVNNNGREINCIDGSDFASNIAYGSASVTGTFDAYMTVELWDTLLDAVANNSDVALQYVISDTLGNSYTILLPRIKVSADSPQATAKDSDITVSFSFTALLDSVEGTSLRITRAVA